MQIIEANGQPGAKLLVNARAADDRFSQQYTPAISEMADGRLAVTWHDPSYPGGTVLSTTIVDPREHAVSVNGTDRDDIYYGSEYGVDVLRGYAGNDRLYGDAGDDILNGGVGADHLDGGTGFNWASYIDAGAGVVANLQNAAQNKGEAEGDSYVNIQGLQGSNFGDALVGANGGTAIAGLDGNDILIGGAGVDKLDGGEGYDRLYGGAGEFADAFYGGDTTSSNIVTYEYSTAGIGITLDLQGNTSTGEAKGDVFNNITGYVGTSYADRMIGKNLSYNEFFGHDGNDVLVGGTVGDYLDGGDGDDLLQGGGGIDTLVGGSGSDTLQGGEGGDDLRGGDGFDFASYADATSGVTASLSFLAFAPTDADGDNYESIEGLIGSNFADNLSGDTDNNVLRGGGGNDTLSGHDGNDTLQGGAGADILRGSNGTDFVAYDDSSTGLTISLGNPGANTGIAAGDKYEEIEGVSGSNSNDLIYGDAAANILLGQAGNDTLDGGAGADRMEGGAGNDVYYVDELDTVIEAAGQGYDTVIVTTGYTLTAGSEIERVVYAGSGPVNLSGNERANALSGGSGNDNLSGGGGNDALSGEGGNDALSGGDGDDVLNGGAGADFMDGGTGNDIYYVDNTGDVASDSGGGIDTVYTSVSYALNTTVENLVGLGSDAIALTGNAFANTITGNAGANKIAGGLGNDVLTGGAGKDVFVFDTKANKSTNKDKIVDFIVKDDSIYLENKYFTKLGKAGTPTKPKQMNKDFFTIGSKAKDKNDYIVYDNKKGVLYYDADGSGHGKAVEIATLSKGLKMTYKDFFVI